MNTAVSFDCDTDTDKACDLKVTISWAWAFENTFGENQEKADKYDTILADLGKGDTDATQNTDLTVSTGADYGLNVAYTLTVTATQVGD